MYGWLAAFGGMLAFGSFAVPIKSDVAKSVDIGELTGLIHRDVLRVRRCTVRIDQDTDRQGRRVTGDNVKPHTFRMEVR